GGVGVFVTIGGSGLGSFSATGAVSVLAGMAAGTGLVAATVVTVLGSSFLGRTGRRPAAVVATLSCFASIGAGVIMMGACLTTMEAGAGLTATGAEGTTVALAPGILGQ